MDTVLFSPSSLFAGSDGNYSEEENTETNQKFEERRCQFPGMELLQEFSFSPAANLLWPGTFAFLEWLFLHGLYLWIDGRITIELGSGTGALGFFLHKSFQLDITTSDYDDAEIEENIAHKS